MDYTAQSWEEFATEKQQEWYEHFGDRDWDKYNISSLEIKSYLVRNIGYAIYGLPDEEPNDDNHNMGYSVNKLNHVTEITETIIKCHQNTGRTGIEDQHVYIGIIFVYMQIDTEDCSHIPTVVFRVMNTEKGVNMFVDTDCRVYESWDHYLKNNKLPKCTYCYPRNGVYLGDGEDQVLVDFGVTPASRLVKKVLNGVDIAGTVVSVGSTVVTAAALFVPVAGPLMMVTAISGAVVGTYGAGRSIETIVDLKKHGQSISLTNSNARNTWLSLGANMMGMAAAGATNVASSMARSGNVLGRAGRFAVNAAQVSCITFNGANIVNTIFILREKSKTGSVTTLDIFQFSASILFFTNSVVNFKSAQTVIRESQESVIRDYESTLRSNRHRKAFTRVARNTRKGLDSMHGDAKVIRGINNINNPDNFFAGVVRAQKQFGKNKAEVSFTDSGHIAINKDLILDPFKFASVDKSQRNTILRAARQHLEGSVTRSEYEAIVNPILNEYGLIVNTPSSSTVCSAFGVRSLTDVKVGGRSVLCNLKPRDAEFLLRIIGKLISPYILPTAIKIAEYLEKHLGLPVNFLHFLDFFNDYIKELLIEMEDAYMHAHQFANQWCKFSHDEEARQEEFLKLILELHSVGKKLMELWQKFDKYLEER